MHIMRKSFFLLFSFFLLASILANAKKLETGFLDCSLAIRTTTYKYQVLVPDNWSLIENGPSSSFSLAPASAATMTPFRSPNRNKWLRPTKPSVAKSVTPNIPALAMTPGTKPAPRPI
jgi:hypothetical protein